MFLRRCDIENDGLLLPNDIKYGFRAYGIHITEDEMSNIMKYFDTAKTGRVSLNELLHAVRGSSLNARRQACVEAAYNKLDNGRGQKVTISDLEDNYDVSPNPQLQSGEKTSQAIYEEFRCVWDTVARDAVISLSEFIDYYKDISPCITGDEIFQNLVKNTWNC